MLGPRPMEMWRYRLILMSMLLSLLRLHSLGSLTSDRRGSGPRPLGHHPPSILPLKTHQRDFLSRIRCRSIGTTSSSLKIISLSIPRRPLDDFQKIEIEFTLYSIRIIAIHHLLYVETSLRQKFLFFLNFFKKLNRICVDNFCYNFANNL